MQETQFIEECIHLIELKFDWGPSTEWTAYHFSKLSEDIRIKTGKTVSDSTLKRMFGRKDAKETYNPQIYTKNAVAVYLGYKDWQELRNTLKLSGPKAARLGSGKFLVFLWVMVVVLFVAAGIIGIVHFTGKKEPAAWIRCADSANYVPYTAVFHYDVTKVKDTVYIDFGNDAKILLPKEKHTITEFYKATGVVYAQILTSGKVLDSVRLVNMTHDWQCGLSTNDSVKRYTSLEDQSAFRHSDRMYLLPDKELVSAVPYKTGYYTEYRLVKDFDAYLDSLVFHCFVKNNELEGGKLCYDIEIWLIGSSGNCSIRFVQPDCFRYSQLRLSEKVYNGRFDDLSAFARDMSAWRQVRIKLLKRTLDVELDGDRIYTDTYKKSLGKLLGIYYRFYGTGSVKQTQLKNPSGKIIYADTVSARD